MLSEVDNRILIYANEEKKNDIKDKIFKVIRAIMYLPTSTIIFIHK